MRRDVKRLVLSRDDFAVVNRDLGVLDERADGQRVAVTVERAESAMTLLGREGVEFRAIDLNLDEILRRTWRVSEAKRLRPKLNRKRIFSR
ncbi:MAG: hypothetical protein HC771_24185 [Synechococcales cyanobacterium CRU_2_2]|nr:hypothetical protein [Synechococcales cyanobacterium CRU_2_2]